MSKATETFLHPLYPVLAKKDVKMDLVDVHDEVVKHHLLYPSSLPMPMIRWLTKFESVLVYHQLRHLNGAAKTEDREFNWKANPNKRMMISDLDYLTEIIIFLKMQDAHWEALHIMEVEEFYPVDKLLKIICDIRTVKNNEGMLCQAM